MRRIIPAITALALFAFAACAGASGPNIPQDATIALDREPVTTAAYVGTTQSISLQVINQGRHALTISSVALLAADGGSSPLLDGGGPFSSPQFSDPLPAQVPGLGTSFVSITYKPNKPGRTTAVLSIESDAKARPHLMAEVSGCAVALDAGVDSGC